MPARRWAAPRCPATPAVEVEACSNWNKRPAPQPLRECRTTPANSP
jgi:hypothetical protein